MHTEKAKIIEGNMARSHTPKHSERKHLAWRKAGVFIKCECVALIRKVTAQIPLKEITYNVREGSRSRIELAIPEVSLNVKSNRGCGRFQLNGIDGESGWRVLRL